MATHSTPSTEILLKLTPEERDELRQLLDTELKETRVEVHRTHTPEYRTEVLQREDLLRGLLAKMQ